MNPQLNFRASEALLSEFHEWSARYTDGDVGAWLGLCHRLVVESGGPILAVAADQQASKKPIKAEGRAARSRARKK